MGRVLITGASGFIGAALLKDLRAAGVDARGSYRRTGEGVVVGEIDGQTDWSRALDGVTSVVHLAGLAHRKVDAAAAMRVNVDGVRRLCEQAANAGVQRFIFISSIKAAGERTHGAPLRESDPPAPETDYGRAKLAAEQIVRAHTAFASIILRPPLVVAADAKANFRTLLRLADSAAPLPFAGVRNKRSLITRSALIGAIKAVLAKTDAAPGLFHLASRPALSTGEIITHLRAGMGRPTGLFCVPSVLLAAAPRVLTESLDIDDSAFRAAYGYGDADLDMGEALRQTGRAWREGQKQTR